MEVLTYLTYLMAKKDREAIRSIGTLAIILVVIIILFSVVTGFFSLIGFSESSLKLFRELIDFARIILLSALLTFVLLIFLWFRGRR